jgi:hypothetical protein
METGVRATGELVLQGNPASSDWFEAGANLLSGLDTGVGG